MTYWAVIPAAGIGTRMQADKPKQYLEYNGETLLSRVVNVFASHPNIKKVIVALHAKDHWWSTIQNTFKHPNKVVTVVGGKARVDSVLCGLTFLNDLAKPEDWVLVHDAARPCIKHEDIDRLIDALKNDPVGGLFGLPVVDTLKRVDQHDLVQETVSRTGLWCAQTPQLFRYALLKQAIEKALKSNQTITDEASAMEYAGAQPKMVLGDARNVKVTFAQDLQLLK